MTHPIDPNAFLMGGGVPSAKFETPGDQVSGLVEELKVTQQTDLQTGEPKTWPNGDPQNQLVVTLADTGQFDPTRADDDGRRKVYVKGRSLTDAIRNAVRAAGAKGLDVGGRLTVAYTGDGVAEKRGFNPPKLYQAAYQAPNPSADFLAAPATPPAVPQPSYGYLPPTGAAPAVGVQPQVAQVPPIQQLIPAAAPAAVAVAAPPAAAPALTPEQAAAIAALSPEQRAALGL